VLSAARTLPAEELPRLVGDLEEIKWVALVRLTSPAAQHPPDELLNVEEAARRLGVSPGYLYRNHHRLPFTRHMGRKLLFSANGIEAYIRSRH
jgi:excisionase family DNA binding protein